MTDLLMLLLNFSPASTLGQSPRCWLLCRYLHPDHFKYIRRSSGVEENIYTASARAQLMQMTHSGYLTCTRGMLRTLASLIWMNLMFSAKIYILVNISLKTVLHLQNFRSAWIKSAFFYPALCRKRLRRLERMCAGVSGLWWLWNKEATSASSIWRLSWRHCWRGWSRSTHQVGHLSHWLSSVTWLGL